MLLGPKFQAFVDKSPLSVMMRGIVERIFHPDRLELIFEEHAVSHAVYTAFAISHGRGSFARSCVHHRPVELGGVADSRGNATHGPQDVLLSGERT